MAVITQTIQPNERRSEVTEMQRALISLGANIAGGRNWGQSMHMCNVRLMWLIARGTP